MQLVSARFTDVVNVVELRTKVISLSSFLLGTAYAGYHAGAFSALRTVLMLVAVLAVDMGTTAFNSYFDRRRGVDSRRFNREADKVLVHAELSPGFALLVALACYAVAVVFGLAVILLVGPEVLMVGVVSMAVGFLYNGGPLPISSTPVGELFAGGFLGGLLFWLSYYVQTEVLTAAALWAGLPSLLLVSAILAVNNTCDVDGDRAAGRHTFAVLAGRRASTCLVYMLVAGAHGLVLWYGLDAAVPGAAGVAGSTVLPRAAVWAGAISAAISAQTLWQMHRRGYSHETKGRQMRAVARLVPVFTLAMLLAMTM